MLLSTNYAITKMAKRLKTKAAWIVGKCCVNSGSYDIAPENDKAWIIQDSNGNVDHVMVSDRPTWKKYSTEKISTIQWR